MSDNIATINAAAAMAYLDASPWHGLGQNILQQMRALRPDQRIDAALEAAQMLYTVASVPLYLADGTEVQGHKAAVRLAADGSVAAVFGPVGEGHAHIQNSRAVDVARSLVEDFGYVPAALGALGNGERCWLLLRAADATITPLPGDDVNGYALLHWGHDGQVALQFLGTTVRVVCRNTLGMATRGRKSWITIRHTASADARVDQAAQLVRGIGEAMRVTGDTFAAMAHRGLGRKQVLDYVARAIPNTTAAEKVSPIIEARRETVLQLVYGGRGAAMANQAVDTREGGASLWAAYNAVTEYFDHVRTAEATNASGLLRAQESALFGGNADLKLAALAEARQLLGAAVA